MRAPALPSFLILLGLFQAQDLVTPTRYSSFACSLYGALSHQLGITDR